MDTNTAAPPITADDDQLRAALAEADLPPLLPSLAYATGDLSLLRPELRIDPLLMREEQAGLTPDQQAAIRDLAFDTLRGLRDGTRTVTPVADRVGLQRIIEFIAGGPVAPEYLPLLEEELAITDGDPRAPKWTKADIAADRAFTVAVIGAGMSGLLAAYRLQQAGVPFVIIEKNADVGGTWLENSYPGCRVDVPSHFYSYSFAQRHDWPNFFSPRAVLLDYFRTFATDRDITPAIRFSTEVSAVVWDEPTATWSLELRTREGEETLTVNAVVSAVGQLNRPKLPVISGMDRFAGPSWHSAEWNHDVDLTGNRVGVIGTGASAAQFCPVVAETATQVTIFQRTPNWLFPVPWYHDSVGAGLTWLFTHVPSYAEWYRFFQFWRGAEGVLPACKVDPEWPNHDRSVSALNDELRDLLTMYFQFEFADRPDLQEKAIPTYPPASKRILVDSGSWPATLKRDNVRLVTDTIAEITETGVRTADNEMHEFDAIVYATGFQASNFLTPMKVVGRGGVDLHGQWDGNASAYLGITYPKFPNFFFLYGPNTNIVVNGSIIWFSECEVHYMVEAIGALLRTGHRAIDCKPEVHDEYRRRIDEGNLQMVWGVSKVSSWYKSASGRVAQNWPFSLLEFWDQTRQPNLADYEVL